MMRLNLQYFGGRGASSSRGSGRAAGSVSGGFPTPALTGSPKQIKWAEDIRKDYIESLKKNFINYSGTNFTDTGSLNAFNTEHYWEMMGETNSYIKLLQLGAFDQPHYSTRKNGFRNVVNEYREDALRHSMSDAQKQTVNRYYDNVIQKYSTKAADYVRNVEKTGVEDHRVYREYIKDTATNILKNQTSAHWWIEHRVGRW